MSSRHFGKVLNLQPVKVQFHRHTMLPFFLRELIFLLCRYRVVLKGIQHIGAVRNALSFSQGALERWLSTLVLIETCGLYAITGIHHLHADMVWKVSRSWLDLGQLYICKTFARSSKDTIKVLPRKNIARLSFAMNLGKNMGIFVYIICLISISALGFDWATNQTTPNIEILKEHGKIKFCCDLCLKTQNITKNVWAH